MIDLYYKTHDELQALKLCKSTHWRETILVQLLWKGPRKCPNFTIHMSMLTEEKRGNTGAAFVIKF